MKATFEFPDDVIPCAVWLNYIVLDSVGSMQIGVRSAAAEELLRLSENKNAALSVVVGKNCRAGIVDGENDETGL